LEDLAQSCHNWYPRRTHWPKWLFFAIAIGPCDPVEVQEGGAAALNLLKMVFTPGGL
jgi:Mn2+/Fe2+ NRAMP family transporter